MISLSLARQQIALSLSLQNPFSASLSLILLLRFSQKLQPNIDGYDIRIGWRRTEAL